MTRRQHTQHRREFLEHLGVASAAILGTGALPLEAAAASPTHHSSSEPWDMSWLDRLKPATYRAVIDANTLEEAYAPDLAGGLIDTFHDVHGTSDDHRPRPGASPPSVATKLETLQKRGVILLVCNVALNNCVRGLAERTKRDVAEVKKEVFANLVPGTTVMPSGVFALMRAQNAGCAYMRGQ